ncbi:MAG: hypothetical protein HYT10_00215 [Candidatus Levybacteria bacterium]|nr:hypothetical protein [Candidatus Levybacteria bacterium]
MTELEELRSEIEAIKKRNKRVEADKAWETSTTRNIFIAVSSFIIIYVVMRLVNADNPFFNALVGALTYLLSTFSYGILKAWWLKKRQL